MAVIILMGAFMALLLFYFNVQYSDIEAFNAVVLIMSNLYGMGVLVLLLGHGLIKLPIYLWKC